MKRNLTYVVALALTGTVVLTSCVQEEESPGVEYMPDMYRSPAIEAYVDYGEDPYYVGDSLATAQRNTMSALQPVDGTIKFNMNADLAWNGFPYAYDNTPEGYDKAGAELTENPVELTAGVFEEGKHLFVNYCQHCHGEKGKGDGKIVTNGNFPPVPAYDGIDGLNIGKMFHTLTYGKGNMGSHASQLTKEERWKVIWYVESMRTGKSLEDMMSASAAPVAPDTMTAGTMVDPADAATPSDGGQ
jgi:mono/diheme cytochrome c family protein